MVKNWFKKILKELSPYYIMDNLDIMTIKRKSNNPNGGPIRVPWRFDSDGNLIIKNPTKHDYNINYYKIMSVHKAKCDLCNRETVWKHMKRHQESNICKKYRFDSDNNGESPTDSI